MRHLIVYDIAENAIRSRVSCHLEGLGTRVQKSVFECDLTPDEVGDLVGHIRAILEPGTGDSVRIYHLCERCWSMALGIGAIRRDDDDPCLILD